MRILWVENHASFVRVTLKQFLSEHAVTVVPSIAAARSALINDLFDIVLVDYDLDDGKGSELVAEVRQRRGALPIIATSSHERGNSLLIAAGATAVCGKTEFHRIRGVIESLAKPGGGIVVS
jgi:DNA-binding response OmpR family regulator